MVRIELLIVHNKLLLHDGGYFFDVSYVVFFGGLIDLGLYL